MDSQLNSLVTDIIKFSESIPDNDLYDLKRKLKTSAKLVKPNVRSLNSKTRKMDKIKGLINAKSNIEEVQEYLTLSQRLRFGNTSDLNDRLSGILNTISKMEIN